MQCDHTLSIFSTMERLSVTRDYIYRKCSVCGKKEKLRHAGKIRTGYSIKAESLRDFDRREYAKDLLQPYEYNKDKKDQELTELYEDAWGDPIKTGKTKMGEKIKPLTKKQIRKAREKMQKRGRP